MSLFKKNAARSRWLWAIALIAAVAIQVSQPGCGASGTVSIPAPVVTKIRISTPDQGMATVSGEAGAVTGGNTVQAINLTQTGLVLWWEPILWGIAHAQTTVEVTAAGDGSFTLEIDAVFGDQIQIRQISPEGDQGPAIVLSAPFQSLATGLDPVTVPVDPDINQALAVGTSGGTPVLRPINFGTTASLGVELALPAACADPIAADVDGTNDQLVYLDSNNNVCSQPLDGSAGGLIGNLTVILQGIAIHQTTAIAAITNNTPGSLVEVSLLNLNTNAFTPVNLTNPAGGVDQSGTPAVCTGTAGGIDYAAVVVTYSNGENYFFFIDLATLTQIGGGIFLDVGVPRNMVCYLGFNAVILDGNDEIHPLFIDPTTPEVQVLAHIDVGMNPTGVAVDPVNNKAYVTNNDDNTISVVDLTTNSVVATLTTGDSPTGIGFKAGGADQLVVIHEAIQNAFVFGSLP